MIELIRRLASRFIVHVACFDRAGAWLPRAAERAASVVEFPIRGFARAGTGAQLLSFARWCRRERLMVVQTCDLYANIFGLPGAALAGVPVRIGSRRELAPDKTRAQLFLQRQAYRCATKVVANSPSARRILEAEGLATGSIAVIPNGVDHRAFAARTPRPRLREILTVANLRPEKNHDVLLRAAAELARNHPDLRLRFAGAGPQRAALESLAASLGLSGRVELLGHRDDVPALLAQADLFVLPSRSEAFPNGAIEAMAAGLPVVASATGGLSDLIAHERTGLLVPPGDAGALAAAMRRLIEEPALAASLGERARREVQARYSFERMADAFEALYLSGLPAGVDVTTHRPEAAGI
jgi:glycosyltransferase involved in cell wall biosynthesis